MKPKIDSTSFGSITVDGKTYEYDILIRINGQVEKGKNNYQRNCMGPLTKSRLRKQSTSMKKELKNLL